MERRIHLADAPPPFCAGCYQAKPDSRHVDFDAAYDGPTFPDENVVGGKVMTVDDLVLCEDCIRLAAGQLGLGDVAEKTAEADRLASTIERLSDRLAAQQEHIANLERAAESRETLATTMGSAQPAPDTSQRRARGGAGGRSPKSKART